MLDLQALPGHDPALPFGSWFPLARNWRAILACYAVWVVLILVEQWGGQRLGSPWIWASVFASPFTHIVAFVFLAPLPWILTRPLSTPWNFILGLFLSALLCEPLAALLPYLDSLVLARAGVRFNLGRLLDLYTSFVGPAMMLAGGLVAARARSEELREASLAEALVAKNRLLQSQIHPHVLFNALNGLAELVYKSPRAAEQAIRHLSDLLRRIMRASEYMRLPLREERKIISDFLALEEIRLQDRLRVVWDWDPELDGIEVPPLLLQPLVENAIKHGISPSVPGGELQVRARMEGAFVLLEVWNSGTPYRKPAPGDPVGIGVANLRSRLALHFGAGATLSIGSSGEGTLACIQIEASQVEYAYEIPPCAGGR